MTRHDDVAEPSEETDLAEADYRERKTEAHLETPWWYWAAFLVLWALVLLGVMLHAH